MLEPGSPDKASAFPCDINEVQALESLCCVAGRAEKRQRAWKNNCQPRARELYLDLKAGFCFGHSAAAAWLRPCGVGSRGSSAALCLCSSLVRRVHQSLSNHRILG